MTVDSYTFLRPEPAQGQAVVRAEKIDSRLFSSPPAGCLRKPPAARRLKSNITTAEVSLQPFARFPRELLYFDASEAALNSVACQSAGAG